MSDRVKTQELARQWDAAKERLRRAKSEVTSAECAVSNAETALAKSVVPKDLRDGETIAVWVRFDDLREELVEVHRDERGNLRATLRERR